MKSLLRLTIVLCLLLTAALPLAAQEPAELDPAAIGVPEDWDIMTAAEFDDYYAELPNFDATVADAGDFWIMLMTPAQVDALLDGETPEDPSEALIAAYEVIYDYQIDPEEILIERVKGFTVTGWHYVDDEPSEGEIHLVSAADGGFYLIDAYGTPESIEEAREDVDGVLLGLAAYARADDELVKDTTGELFVPEGWEAIPADEYNDFFAEVPNLEATTLLSDKVTVLVLTPEQVETLLDGAEMPEEADALLFDAYQRVYDFEIFSDEIVDRRIGGMDTRAYLYIFGDEEESGQGESYVFPAGDGWYFVDVYALEGDTEEVTLDVDAILESVAALAAAR
jgi:hypothetical protein